MKTIVSSIFEEKQMREIITTNGFRTQVDDEFFEYLSQWKWYAIRHHTGKNYVIRTIKDEQGKQKFMWMHREIFKNKRGYKYIDHIDGNPLNNQKSNLRVCTNQQNCMNRNKVNKQTSSKYKGVCWRKDSECWRARLRIRVNNKLTLINLGNFEDEIEAARVYDEAAKKYFGEFAKLNF